MMDESTEIKKKLSPFDFIVTITDTKENLMKDGDNEKLYYPHIINMTLSSDLGCMIMANEMNTRPHIPNCGQYKFLLGAVIKKKRYLKFPKKQDEITNLDIVMKYYSYSTAKAMDVLSILTEAQIDILKTKMFIGGKI